MIANKTRINKIEAAGNWNKHKEVKNKKQTRIKVQQRFMNILKKFKDVEDDSNISSDTKIAEKFKYLNKYKAERSDK